MNNIFIDDFKAFDEGFYAVCDAAAKTLGAEGKLSLLENLQHNLPPQHSKDGFNTAQRIRFKSKVKNFGSLQAITAAATTLERSGDSTTSTLVLAKALLQGIKRKDFNKKVEKGINNAVEEVLNSIKLLNSPVTPEILRQIAITSVNSDVELGEKIIDAYSEVGVNGIVDVRENPNSTEVEVLKKSGFKLDAPYSSPFFINKESNASWEAENVLVVALETYQSDETIINFIKTNRRNSEGGHNPILFLMEKMNMEFVTQLVEMVKANHLNACLVVSPDGHNELKCVNNLRDVALFTGGISYDPKDNEIVAGFANKVTVDSTNTVILCDDISEKVVQKIEDLKIQLKNGVDVEFTKLRIQRLEGVSALILVGGQSSSDIAERMDRVDDGCKAVKNAAKEGWICGGGATLLYISERMNIIFENRDVQRGYNLVKKAICAPHAQIIRNSNRRQESNIFRQAIFGGKDYGKFSRQKYGLGYNASKDEVSNLIEDGVIDSALSIRVALESAKEAAIKMLLTAVIVTFPE